jgi:hypothetical protein
LIKIKFSPGPTPQFLDGMINNSGLSQMYTN